MIAKFEPSGTQVRKGKLLIRLDFFPELTDKTYPLHYVQGQVNPCLCHFVPAPDIFTVKDLADYLKVFTTDRVATIDQIMTLPDSAHYISPYMRSIAKWSDKLVNPQDAVDLIASVNDRLKSISVSLVSGKAQEVEPKSIVIGLGATDRAGGLDIAGNTVIDQNVVASGTGTIDTWEVWFASGTITGFIVGTCFVVSGNALTTRDYESIGAVTAASKQTFTGKSTDVTAGDYPCTTAAAGAAKNIERDTSGVGYWYKGTQTIPFTNLDFGAATATRTISIYGTGTEPSTGRVIWEGKRHSQGAVLRPGMRLGTLMDTRRWFPPPKALI